MSIRSIPLYMFAIFITGSTSTKSFVQSHEANSDTALIYFIRKNYPPTAWAGDLLVNGKIVAKLAENSCVKANTPIGDVEIEL